MVNQTKNRLIIAIAFIVMIAIAGRTAKGIHHNTSEDNMSIMVDNTVQEGNINSLDIDVEMLTNLTSHRDDNIPSIKPDDFLKVKFNVTNLNQSSIHSLQLVPNVNKFGILKENVTSETDILESNSSWISNEYVVQAVKNDSLSGGALDLTIVLDQSGSMGDEIDSLKENLIEVVNQLYNEVPNLQIGLVLFGGGKKENPYVYEELITPLTTDVEKIVNVLEETEAGGSIEPWGDALWVANNWMNWREDIPNVIVLITDEPGDDGEIIKMSEINQLYEELSSNNMIMCSIAASGSSVLTITRLKDGAETTKGTYFQIGSEDYPDTSELPNIIGELIIKYSVERNLKISARITFLTEPGDFSTQQTKEFIFSVIVDDLPPEIITWTYFSEDFIQDKRYINVLIEVKDLTGVPFVEIYYRFNSEGVWITSKLTNKTSSAYSISLEFQETDETLNYYIYTKDYLDNSNLTDIYSVKLEDETQYSLLESGKRKHIQLNSGQATNLKLRGNTKQMSKVIFRLSEMSVHFLLSVYDVNLSETLVEMEETSLRIVDLEINHVLKVKIWATETINLKIFNVVSEELQFKESTKRKLTEDNAFLFQLDNKFNDSKERSILATSEYIYPSIILFNASDRTEIMAGSFELVLPEEVCYALIFTEYHLGEANISFHYEEINEPHEHFDGVTNVAWDYLVFFIPLIAIFVKLLRKNKKYQR